MIDTDTARRALHAKLEPLGFVGVEAPEGTLAAWVRKTWNTNRGVVLVADADAGRWAQENKLSVGKELGYFPFFYGMGLQVVAVSPDADVDEEKLEAAVDRFDNQRCIVQSVFALDTTTGELGQGRTWGQVVTGRFQDAIAEALSTITSRPHSVSVRPPDVDNPFSAPQ